MSYEIEDSSCKLVVVNPDKNEHTLLEKRYSDRVTCNLKIGFREAIPELTEMVKKYCA